MSQRPIVSMDYIKSLETRIATLELAGSPLGFPTSLVEAKYIQCTWLGSDPPHKMQWHSNGYIENIDGTDLWMIYMIPLPMVLGTKNLHINTFRIGLIAVDSSDYFTYFKIICYTDHDSYSTQKASASNYYTPSSQLVSIDLNEFQIGGTYQQVFIMYQLYLTTASQYKQSYVEVEFYYA